MGLTDKIPTVLGSDDRTFTYECRNCERAFESDTADMSGLSCPECSSTRIRSLGTA